MRYCCKVCEHFRCEVMRGDEPLEDHGSCPHRDKLFVDGDDCCNEFALSAWARRNDTEGN